MKTITIQLDAQTAFQVVLLKGTEPAALNHMVASRSGHANGSFFLTLGPEKTDPIVPLSSCLPDGMVLYFHLQQDEQVGAKNSASANDEESPNNGSHSEAVLSSCTDSQKGNSWWHRLHIVESVWTPTLHHNERKSWENVLYLNQLGTDLANERTMLAWIRTMLAAVRTAFSYMRYTAVQSSSLTAALMLIATLVLLSGLNAAGRYYQVRHILEKRPKTFGRVTLMPYILLAAAAAILNSVGVYSGKWV